MKDQNQEIPEKFRITDSLRDKIQRLLPPQQPKPKEDVLTITIAG